MFDPMSRRSFVKAAAISALAGPAVVSAQSEKRAASTGSPTEWSYTTATQYADPFNDIEVDVIVKLPSGQEERIPAFWAGGSTWTVRYAAAAPGLYQIRSVCTDAKNRDLHGQMMTLKVEPTLGRTPTTNTASCKSLKTNATFSTPTAHPSFGWVTPGGWASASA